MRRDGLGWLADHPLLTDLRHVVGWLTRRTPGRPSWLATAALLIVVAGVLALLLTLIGR
jgi:predicted PurR-regulated permease PerM